MMKRLLEARDHLRDRCPKAPDVALVLGSGYKAVGERVSSPLTMAYAEIPHFPACTNPAHPGRLLVGELWGRTVAVLQGRIHCYEGYRAEEVVLPVRALALWGVQNFILTNAAGAINAGYQVGEFMAITDHINLMGQNPLTGPELTGLGKERFTPLSDAYTSPMLEGARAAAARAGIRLHEGVYAALAGPSYETPAEIRMLRTLGADAVGMSTVPEVIALRHMDRRVFGLSCLTNAAAGLSSAAPNDKDIREVLDRPEVQVRLEVILKGALHVA
jgi:purine-nucleoside phosphorylase